MKKLIGLLAVAVLLFGAVFYAAAAEDTMNVLVRITDDVGINILVDNYDFGELDADTLAQSTVIQVQSTSENITTNLSFDLDDPANWTSVTTDAGEVGSNVFKLSAVIDNNGTGLAFGDEDTVLPGLKACSATVFADGDGSGLSVPPQETRDIYLQMHTPSVSTTLAQQSIVFRVTNEAAQ